MNEVQADQFYTSKPIEILMAEDNPGDVRPTREALKHGKGSNTLHVVEDGAPSL